VSDRFDERLLRVLEGRASDEERAEVERRLAASTTLKAEMEEARRGLEAMRRLAGEATDEIPPLADATWSRIAREGTHRPGAGRRRLLRRAAMIAALVLLPASGWFARGLMAPPLATLPGPGPDTVTPPATFPDPRLRPFVLLFEGTWPDGDRLEPWEELERGEVYASWFEELEAEGRLATAYELGAAPAVRVARGPLGGVTETVLDTPPDRRLVGLIVIRAVSEQEARQIAAESPHLRFGGSVLLKPAGGG